MSNKNEPTVIFSTRVYRSKANQYDQTCKAVKIERSTFIRDALDAHDIYLNDRLSRSLAFQNSRWGRILKEEKEQAKITGSLIGLLFGCGIALLSSK